MKYSSFSERYLREKEIKDAFGGDPECITNWSSELVSFLVEKNPNFDYKVVISITPNPPDYKGCDDIQITVWKTPQPRKSYLDNSVILDKPIMAVHSAHHQTIKECIDNIHENLKQLFPKPKDEIVEIDGKKYRLTEIK